MIVLHILSVFPRPVPQPTVGDINTEGIIAFLASKIVPIMLAVLALVFLGRAKAGNIGQVLTSTVIAIIGIAFLAGATSMFLFGDQIIKVIMQ